MAKLTRAILVALVGLVSAAMLSSCTQMPTEKQGVSDMRPEISFASSDGGAYGAKVIIDGLVMGSVGDYLVGSASLKIRAGTHTIHVVKNGQTILQEKFYVGDGVNRTFNVK